jgi:hypothetical protein
VIQAIAIRHRFPLPSLFPGAVKLSDKRFKTKCPLHEDKTASLFILNGEKGWRWRCFGCGEHGDAIDLIMKTERVSFAEAIARFETFDLGTVVDIWKPKAKRYVLVCDKCNDEHIDFDVMDYPANWEIAPDGIAALGPRCLDGLRSPMTTPVRFPKIFFEIAARGCERWLNES